MSKRRGLWLVFNNKERSHTEMPQLFVNQPLAEHYERPFKAVEIKPGEIVISEDELVKAFWSGVHSWLGRNIKSDEAWSVCTIRDMREKLFHGATVERKRDEGEG